MQGQWHVSMAGRKIIAGPNDLKEKRKNYAFQRQFNQKPSITPGCPGNDLTNVMNGCRGESKAHHGASAEVYLVRHVQISEDDIESISTAASMQLVHGLLAIHHSGDFTVACPLQDA